MGLKIISGTRPPFGRRNMFQRGTIYVLGKSPMPCAVRDLSLAGAQLVVASSADLPPTFRLLVDGSRFERDCSVVERSGDRVDVAFRCANKA
jgi:hypothetical protein